MSNFQSMPREYRLPDVFTSGFPIFHLGTLLFMSGKERTPFGERLYKARKESGLTQVQAARKVGMSQGTLAEAEKIGTGSAYTAQLAAVYKVRAEWLADGGGEMRDVPSWPFPDIDKGRFDRLTDPQKYEIQGIVRKAIADFERGQEDRPSGGSSISHPESRHQYGT